MRTVAAKNTKVQRSGEGGDEVLTKFWAKQTCSTLVEYISSATHTRQGAGEDLTDWRNRRSTQRNQRSSPDSRRRIESQPV